MFLLHKYWCEHVWAAKSVPVMNVYTVVIWGGGAQTFSTSIQNPESVATLPPFSPIEGQKWFDQISSQWESQKNRFALTYFGKIQFLPPCIWILPFMSTASVVMKGGLIFIREVKTGFCRVPFHSAKQWKRCSIVVRCRLYGQDWKILLKTMSEK